jgi:ribosomal protein S6--L-glutamate ligase
MGLEVAGVDMLEGSSGPKILEINSSPGLEGIERASGVDVATAIVQHAERVVTRHKGRRKRAVDARILDAIELERTVAKVRPPRSGRQAAR